MLVAQVAGAEDIGALLSNPQFAVPLKQLVLAELQQALVGADIPDIKLTKEVKRQAERAPELIIITFVYNAYHSCCLTDQKRSSKRVVACQRGLAPLPGVCTELYAAACWTYSGDGSTCLACTCTRSSCRARG